jgi:hypothetical protein
MPRELPFWDLAAEYRGHWWPPGKLDVHYPGVLRFDDQNPVLTIESPAIGQEVFELGRVPTLHGTLDNGHRVTLWDLRQHALIHHPVDDAIMRHERTFTYAILGELLDDYRDAVFTCSAVRFHDLHEWSMFSTPVAQGTPEDEHPQHAAAFLVDLTNDLTGVQHQVQIRVEHPRRVETSPAFPGGAIIDHPGDHVRVVFECDPPATAGFHDLLLRDMQALLTFCYQAGAPVTGECLATCETGPVLAVTRRDTFRGHPPHGQASFQMLLSCSVADPSALLPAWSKAVEDLFPAPQVITLYHHSSRGLLEQSTASAIAATENLHSAIGPTKHRIATGYLAERTKHLLKKSAGEQHKEFRQYLREKLKENRPTLGTRLDELLDIITLERVGKMGIEPAAWSNDVKEVRNKLAHTGAHVPKRGDSGEQLNRVNDETRAILSLLLLGHLGVDDATLDRAAEVLAQKLRWSRG